jgi:parallel beta-helix repeat protein
MHPSLALSLLLPSDARAAPVVCGQVLTQSTALDNDLVGCPGDGLVVGADGIVITFAGHTIEGTGAPGSVGIRNEGYDFVVITDGDHVGLDIGGFETSILLEDAAWNVVSDLFVQDPFDGAFGILIDGGHHHVITGNDARGGAPNDCDTVTGAGIGVFYSHHNLIFDNDAHLADFGIALVGSNANVVSFNGAAPDFSDGNECVGIALVDADFNWIGDNVAAHSDEGGIVVDGASRWNTIVGNVATMNAADGIHIDQLRTFVVANDASENFDLGIEAVPGVIDLGGNTASGNGNPAECLNVACP